jgi:hypothetical protein
MKLKEAIKLVEYHNEWRRGGEGIPVCPTKLGLALDLITKSLNDFLSERYTILKRIEQKNL